MYHHQRQLAMQTRVSGRAIILTRIQHMKIVHPCMHASRNDCAHQPFTSTYTGVKGCGFSPHNGIHIDLPCSHNTTCQCGARSYSPQLAIIWYCLHTLPPIVVGVQDKESNPIAGQTHHLMCNVSGQENLDVHTLLNLSMDKTQWHYYTHWNQLRQSRNLFFGAIWQWWIHLHCHCVIKLFKRRQSGKVNAIQSWCPK